MRISPAPPFTRAKITGSPDHVFIGFIPTKARNVQVHEGVTEDEFVRMREARDATLAAPLLLLPSIQVNIRAGKFPPAEANGVHYLKVPVKLSLPRRPSPHIANC